MSWFVVIEQDKKHLYISKRIQSKKASEGYGYSYTASIRLAKKFNNVINAQEWRDDCGDESALVVKGKFEGSRMPNR